ncbi:MAG: bifunctional tRNA (5-methylaminomethyl-2-thiouridine)(34)-methyltransferase MnmD/FAD-dependent 5-carboxymethylaminomethyl-2-thiouridine(34) oxidoreductase MnmC [Burkholderiaceae bacterium]|nr:MAG: bifunctional tRNA (5-methylaminomethyl-2-thiouridine)(34)-methyltransferase MnmD/FAD-dependent 5-carboxymethylaminomethyl-2-thiouridine(34) oxidoreductase MnmC [Burkholderiaceae bacterium]
MSDRNPSPPDSPLDWRDGQPVSRQFGDVYFSRASGLEETRHVFLRHNRLAERFAALSPDAQFTIAETGFGTGLNFLCAWQCWQQHAPAGARLHFVSVERYPLDPADLQKALALWPELAQWAELLLAQYRLPSSGWHRFNFGNVFLTLIIGDAALVLPEIVAQVDAWFLDGFAPAKNPQMWSLDVLQHVARLARPGATLATFTSVGEVRRSLSALGFAMEKVRGFGPKREMLCGVKNGAAELVDSVPERSVLIIGAGIAGASVAHALAQRGWQVTVLDRHDHPAGGASGNPLGILYPRLSHKTSPLAQLIRQGFQHSVRSLNALPIAVTGWNPCGVLQLAFDDEEAQRIAAIAEGADAAALGTVVDQDQASALAGLPLPHGGLWLPQAGYVTPAAWCAHLLNHAAIRFAGGCAVDAIEHDEHGWKALQHGRELARASVLVLCTASESQGLPQLAHLPIKPLRGQINRISVLPESAGLRAVVCGEGYVAPACDGTHVFGASFDRERTDTQLTRKEQEANLAQLASLCPAVFGKVQAQSLSAADLLPGRAALRATSPDFLPMLGPLAQDDLWVSLAHGARGLITAPLAAEILVAQLLGEPLPVSRTVWQACQAGRFKATARKIAVSRLA